MVSTRWAGTTVRISPALVAEALRSPEGPVLRRMMVYGDRVKERARAKLKEGFPADFLGPQIVKRVVIGSNGPHVLVGADHTTTHPHAIEGNPLLVFYWPKAGRVVYLHRVNHPGSDLGDYLLRVLSEALSELRGAL